MLVRRCAHLFIEPRETLDFDLGRLLAGETGLVHHRQWIGLASHLEEEIALDDAEVSVIGTLSVETWEPIDALRERHGSALIDSLLGKGVLIGDDEGHAAGRATDETLRAGHWRPLSAVHHRHTRWSGIDTLEAERKFGRDTDRPLLDHLGTPEVPVLERCDAEQRIKLDAVPDTPLEALVRRRVTCRNFDRTRPVPFADFSHALYRAFGTRAVSNQPGITVMKRAAPSGGGLHPTEAYLLVQNVEGVVPGLYHYHPIDHALEPIAELDPSTTMALARRLVAGQQHFMDAHVVIALASRFRRTFWKYRNHAKSYRAVVLDAGHLSQMLYLGATERGLAAFITAAVNEADIEQTFGLDPMTEGVLAICGFGWRGHTVEEVEFDPLAEIWPAGTMERIGD